MNTSPVPLFAQDSINEAVFGLISALAWEAVAESPEFKKEHAKHLRVIKAVYKELGFEMGTQVENTPNAYASMIGAAMFKIGLQIGRHPELLLSLPE